MKKIIAALAALAIAATMSISAVAATGLNENEQDIMDLLNTKVTTAADVTLGLPPQYIAQAKTYMRRSDVDIDKATAEKTMDAIREGMKIVEESEAVTIGTFHRNDDWLDPFVEAAKKAAKINGLTLKYNKVTHIVTVYKDGKLVSSTDPAVKVTGTTDYTGAAVGAVLAVLAAAVGAAYVLKSKKASANA